MTRTKIDYGIDLGTTNSSITRMENGSPVIKKSTSGSTQTDTTPSCVSYNKHKNIFVGQKAYETLASERLSAFRKNDASLINTFEEFKRTMGTDELKSCKNMGTSYSAEQLSAEVLKTLKGYIQDEDTDSVVITVPAKFQGTQKDATKKAAELAGFQHCLLLQEPIAASMAYGINVRGIDGSWLVFDFGGGTFDAALMSASEGIMKVIDTEGDRYLGGKNIDYAIVDKIIIPYLEEKYSIDNILADRPRRDLLRNAVKRFAEEAKIYFSLKDNINYTVYTDEPFGVDDDGDEMELDLSVTNEDYEAVVKPIFQRAIDVSHDMLKNNHLTGSDLKTVLMVGGPTQAETLREMIRNQITAQINISIDPMTVVAKGAALFASTKEIPDGIRKVDKSKVRLKLVYQTDTVETEEKVGIRVLRNESESDIPDRLFIELKRQDKGWVSGRTEIKGDASILDLLLEPGKSNSFEISISDEKGTHFPSDPDSFSIIQGFKIAGATLPYDLCINIYGIAIGREHLDSIRGLQKNQLLPAKGSGSYQTQKDIRPGNKEDIIKIPVYYGVSGDSWENSNQRGEIVISGEQLPGMLPKGSMVELSIEVDDNELIKVSASFPYLDDHIVDDVIELGNTSVVSTSTLEKRLRGAYAAIDLIEEDYPAVEKMGIGKIRVELEAISLLLESGGIDADSKGEIYERLCKCQNQINTLQAQGELPLAIQELNDAFDRLEELNDQYGDDKTVQVVEQLRAHVTTALESNDLKIVTGLASQIRSINFALIDQGAGVALEISIIKGFDDDFDMNDWKDRTKARKLINDAKQIINANRPTKDNLRPIVSELYGLLPNVKNGIGIIDEGLLTK